MRSRKLPGIPCRGVWSTIINFPEAEEGDFGDIQSDLLAYRTLNELDLLLGMNGDLESTSAQPFSVYIAHGNLTLPCVILNFFL